MLDALATPVGYVLRYIHQGVSLVFDPASGLAWGLSIVLLTITVRLVLFPLFVKQIKSQRRMQEIAPMVKELQKKHKGDRETLNQELMKLYKENNANPVAGCLPLLLQLPVFFALFHVIRNFREDDPRERFGLTAEMFVEGGRAQVFGAPIAANFRDSGEFLATLGADSTTVVRLVCAVLVIIMGATTYWTQRQMIARAGATDPQQVLIQKFLLYVLPLSFAVSGVIFPVGVLLYWCTTNIWSMGQQAYVIKRMPPPVAPGQSGAAGKAPAGGAGRGPKSSGPTSSGPRGGRSTGPPAPATVPSAAVPAASAAPGSTGPTGPTGGGGARPAGRPAGAAKGRAAGSRRNKRKGGRR